MIQLSIVPSGKELTFDDLTAGDVIRMGKIVAVILNADGWKEGMSGYAQGKVFAHILKHGNASLVNTLGGWNSDVPMTGTILGHLEIRE